MFYSVILKKKGPDFKVKAHVRGFKERVADFNVWIPELVLCGGVVSLEQRCHGSRDAVALGATLSSSVSVSVSSAVLKICRLI